MEGSAGKGISAPPNTVEPASEVAEPAFGTAEPLCFRVCPLGRVYFRVAGIDLGGDREKRVGMHELLVLVAESDGQIVQGTEELARFGLHVLLGRLRDSTRAEQHTCCGMQARQRGIPHRGVETLRPVLDFVAYPAGQVDLRIFDEPFGGSAIIAHEDRKAVFRGDGQGLAVDQIEEHGFGQFVILWSFRVQDDETKWGFLMSS